jgi:hypothetical protein
MPQKGLIGGVPKFGGGPITTKKVFEFGLVHTRFQFTYRLENIQKVLSRLIPVGKELPIFIAVAKYSQEICADLPDWMWDVNHL